MAKEPNRNFIKMGLEGKILRCRLNHEIKVMVVRGKQKPDGSYENCVRFLDTPKVSNGVEIPTGLETSPSDASKTLLKGSQPNHIFAYWEVEESGQCLLDLPKNE